MPTFCTHCGAALTPGSAFCAACGQPVATAAPPDPAQAAPPPVPPPAAPSPQAPYGQQTPLNPPPPRPFQPGPPQPPYRPPGPSPGQKLQNLPLLQPLPAAMRLPAVVIAALLVLGALGKMLSHGGGSTPGGSGGGTSPSAQAGVFSGLCTTEAGKPLANVDVSIAGLTSAGQNTSVEAHTDANGVYSQTLPPGKYSVGNALYPVTLGTTNYNLPLATTDGENNDPADIGPGVVRNLVLHIHGKIAPALPDNAWQSYYGGNVIFGVFGKYQISQVPDGSITEMTLVPEGPLVDGTPGQTLTLRQVNHMSSEGTYDQFNDIPIGQYTMTVRLLNPDGSLLEPMTINPVGAAGNDPSGYKPSLTGVVFPAGNDSGIGVMQMSLNDGG